MCFVHMLAIQAVIWLFSLSSQQRTQRWTSIRLWWSSIDRQSTAKSGWSQNKKISPAAPAQGSVTRENPTRGKTGTINSQLLAQAACRKLNKLKKQTKREDSQKRSIRMGGRETCNSVFKTEDRPQWRNKCWNGAYIAFKDRRACVWKLYFSSNSQTQLTKFF